MNEVLSIYIVTLGIWKGGAAGEFLQINHDVLLQ